jgi:hypothetical protein
VYGTLKSTELYNTMFGTYIQVVMGIHTSTGRNFSPASVTAEVPYFKDTETLVELKISEVAENSDQFKAFVKRGEKYLKLIQKPAYVQLEGNLIRRSYWGNTLRNAKGRAMVDIKGMRISDPNYSSYFGFESRSGETPGQFDLSNLTDQIKASCSPFLYGFSFTGKIWGEFTIDQVSDIAFRTDAYEKLVIPEETKEIVFALVEDKVSGETDIIDGKGGGVIFLMAGPPGGGKTLTAESIAEKLQRPLHAISVGELGTNVAQLEKNLRAILEVATSWNAILLIDEADIFLEARTDLDIERNAMVAVFLRLLEYFPGILFLTTNRASNLDEAFDSRITMSIYYDKLNRQARTSVWKNLLNNAGVKGIDHVLLSGYELNGRQIKHTIKAAGAFARYKGRLVKMEDFAMIIHKRVQFQLRPEQEVRDAEYSEFKEINHVPDVKKVGFFAGLLKFFGVK